MNPSELIEKLKEKAQDFARTHAAANAHFYYTAGKRDAAVSLLMLARDEGSVGAIEEVARQVLKQDPDNQHARWILENKTWKS